MTDISEGSCRRCELNHMPAENVHYYAGRIAWKKRKEDA